MVSQRSQITVNLKFLACFPYRVKGNPDEKPQENRRKRLKLMEMPELVIPSPNQKTKNWCYIKWINLRHGHFDEAEFMETVFQVYQVFRSPLF